MNRLEEIRFENYARKQLTYDQRKAHALANGVPVTYLGCPLCGLNRPVKGVTRSGRRRDRFMKDTEKMLQYRIGGGRGIGFFFTDPSDLKNHVPPKDLSDLYKSNDPEEKAIFNNLKEEVIKIMDEIDKIERGEL